MRYLLYMYTCYASVVRIKEYLEEDKKEIEERDISVEKVRSVQELSFFTTFHQNISYIKYFVYNSHIPKASPHTARYVS